jgi:D-alanyl-D-alanine carboxypeptidase
VPRLAALLALTLTLAATAAAQAQTPRQPYESRIQALPAPVLASLVNTDSWRPGCPVHHRDLRLLEVTAWGWDGRPYTGQLVVHEDAAAPLATVFRKLYRLEFPIRHMRLGHMYGPKRAYPADGDVTGSFRCRQSVPSPCVGGSASGRWSNHAYGLAVDVNPVENPYFGCGAVRDRRSRPYLNRSRLRKGMVTPAVVRAFASIGWGWGGSWSGDTKDWMHFSHNGR